MRKVFFLLVVASLLSACGGPSQQQCRDWNDEANTLAGKIKAADESGYLNRTCGPGRHGSGADTTGYGALPLTQQQKDENAADVAACEDSKKRAKAEQVEQKERLAQINQEKAKC